MGSEKLYSKRLDLTSYGDHHLTDHKVGGAKGVFWKDYLSLLQEKQTSQGTMLHAPS